MQKPRQFKTIILEDLKKRGLTNIAQKVVSMRYETFSMGNALRVRTKGLTVEEHVALKDILAEYEYGRFDAMTDYAYNECDKTKERQAKYVTLYNEEVP